MIPSLVLANMLIHYGLPITEVETMLCIAQKESSLDSTKTHKNRNGTHDHGLFQINDVNFKKCNLDKQSVINVHKNTVCAITIYQTQGLTAWSTYKQCKKELANEIRHNNGRHYY